jgi:hypothetical protein
MSCLSKLIEAASVPNFDNDAAMMSTRDDRSWSRRNWRQVATSSVSQKTRPALVALHQLLDVVRILNRSPRVTCSHSRSCSGVARTSSVFAFMIWSLPFCLLSQWKGGRPLASRLPGATARRPIGSEKQVRVQANESRRQSQRSCATCAWHQTPLPNSYTSRRLSV